MDWKTVVLPILGALLTWVGLTVRKAIRNRGKTELDLADEVLDEAMRRAEAAHASADPKDDADADAAVARAKTIRAHALRLKAIADAIGDTEE